MWLDVPLNAGELQVRVTTGDDCEWSASTSVCQSRPQCLTVDNRRRHHSLRSIYTSDVSMNDNWNWKSVN